MWACASVPYSRSVNFLSLKVYLNSSFFFFIIDSICIIFAWDIHTTYCVSFLFATFSTLSSSLSLFAANFLGKCCYNAAAQKRDCVQCLGVSNVCTYFIWIFAFVFFRCFFFFSLSFAFCCMVLFIEYTPQAITPHEEHCFTHGFSFQYKYEYFTLWWRPLSAVVVRSVRYTFVYVIIFYLKI